MFRLPERVSRSRLIWLCVVLAGCATAPRAPLTADQQITALGHLDAFELSGRVAVTRLAAGKAEQGVNASVEWQQQQGKSKLKLTGLFGVGGLQLEYSADEIKVISANGEVFTHDDAEQLLVHELGFLPPFASLAFWARGVAAPGVAPLEQSRDANGLLQQLQQEDWRIVYDPPHRAVHSAAGDLLLPTRLTATNGDLKLKLVIDRWRIK